VENANQIHGFIESELVTTVLEPPDENLSSCFDELVRPHLDKLYRLSFRLTQSVTDAEDLLQDVLCKIYERRAELSSISDLGPWLSRVLYNQFIDSTRKQKRRRLRVVAENELPANSSVESYPDPHSDPQTAAVTQFDIDRVSQALQQLSVEHSTVIVMHDVEGYKLEEMQVITGVPIGTLKSRLSRARTRLKEILTSDGTF
jgi:RNA polymerase sigma factor (sigma-70 family)